MQIAPLCCCCQSMTSIFDESYSLFMEESLSMICIANNINELYAERRSKNDPSERFNSIPIYGFIR